MAVAIALRSLLLWRFEAIVVGVFYVFAVFQSQRAFCAQSVAAP
jgi:hypothetical protein